MLLADNGVTPAKGQVEKAGALRERKDTGRGRTVDNIKSSGGTSSTYLLAKLNRDRPDIAKDYAEGRFKNVGGDAGEAPPTPPIKESPWLYGASGWLVVRKTSM